MLRIKRAFSLFFPFVFFIASCEHSQPVKIPAPTLVLPNVTARATVESGPREDALDRVSSISSQTPVTPTITPTFTVTPTSTPQPPLADHEWHPETVLISMRETYGDGGTVIGDLGTTWFILYADGSLFVNRFIVSADAYEYQVLAKQLNREEICRHLNTLDQIGFLDYDASNFAFIGGKPYEIGAGSTLIRVNAWKSKDDSYYDLGFYLRKDITDELYGQEGYPIVVPALRNTYYFLNQYPETGLEIYEPDRLAVWIVPANYLSSDFESTAQTWKLNTPSLRSLLAESSIYTQGSEEKYIELQGEEAKASYAYLGSTDAVHIFVQDMADGTKQYFALKARPLLPFEELNEESMSEIAASRSAKPNSNLSCFASDGVLPIPTSPSP